MELIKPTTWNTVFAAWRSREANDPGWIKCATAVKGWPDWKSWRGFTAQQINAPARQWQIFQFTDPLAEIPEMLLGPFSSWQDGLARPNTLSFAQLFDQPDKYQKFSKNEKVRGLLATLPFPSQFIGLRRLDLNKIVCIEGHHRAAAITLAKLQKKPIDFDSVKMTLALADIPAGESRTLFDRVLARGSAKN